MNNIFVIIGHAGQHDDYRTWTTKGFYKRQDAVEYQKKCIDEANRITKEMKALEQQFKFDVLQQNLSDTLDPVIYWTDVQGIIDSNTVDNFFEYDDDIDYTIESLEVK